MPTQSADQPISSPNVLGGAFPHKWFRIVSAIIRKIQAIWMTEKNNTLKATTIIIEPFYGGSHKQMIQQITTLWEDNTQYALFTTPAKKWKW